MFIFLAKVRVFSYENDFGNHESVNQAGEIVEIRIAKIVQQEHSMRRNGSAPPSRAFLSETDLSRPSPG